MDDVPDLPIEQKQTQFQRTGIILILENVVATVYLDCELDLRSIALRARNAEYDTDRNLVMIRIRNPKTTALVFDSGYMFVTGAKLEKDAEIASKKFVRVISKLGFNAQFTEFQIQNIVASCNLNFCVKLEDLAYSHSDFCSYEPELYPGLIYKMVSPKIVLIIFPNGKIVFAGAKAREDIYDAFDNIYPVLEQYRKT